ncbi:MAG TPA: hypothetical protein VI461_10350 [Chitinophagaceae bacterium]|nr:hypothetical protein [Chitinophagaceae bacterium]
MKKLFTLIAATLLTVAVFAADHRPVVTLKTSGNYEVVIDGRSYRGNGIIKIPLMHRGQHSIKVFERGRGYFNMRGKRLVSASTFYAGRQDVDIRVNYRGRIRITEDRFGDDRRNDRRDNDWDNRHNDDGRYHNY